MKDKIVVLMSTYNGEKYLKEQIDSVLNQKNVEVQLLVRDDGSKDNTINILKEYKQNGKLDYYMGENIKPAKSFMNLIMNAPGAEYYAFCDQDDFWHESKLISGIRQIRDTDKPALYYCKMNIVDERLQKYGEYYREEKKAKSLEYSCVFGSEIPGCTMIFNSNLLNIIQEYNPEYLTMHDGWIHKVCLCAHGVILGENISYIDYRQHGNNVVGIKKKGFFKKALNHNKNKGKCSSVANELINGYSSYLNQNEYHFLSSFKSNHLLNNIKLLPYNFGFNIGIKMRIKFIIKIITNQL